MAQNTENGDTSKDASTSNSKGPEIGTSCTVMRLWEGRSPNDRLIWLKEPPKVKPEEKSIEESPQYAITLLHRMNNDLDEQKLESIIMRGPELRKFLEGTIPNTSSFYNESEHGIVMRSPFRLLFWHLDQIDAAAKSEDKKLSEVTTLLQGVLMHEFRHLLAKRNELLAQQEMNFSTLWTLFKPGIPCLTTYVGEKVIVKVLTVEVSRDPMGKIFYRIKYETLGWDGDCFGWQESYKDIFEFSGRIKVKDLEVIPLEYNKDPQIIDQLASRGRTFVELAMKEPHTMSFSGETLDREISPMWWQGEQKKKMSGRVVLDARAYSHYYRRVNVSKWKKRPAMRDAINGENADRDLLMYCSPEFHCFDLQRKRWIRIWIDDIEEVQYNESAYPSLVLPGDYKELLLGFAEAQIDGYGFDDVIAGKGQGILMLLAGPPGTGKTLTAEAMAEHMRRPLYSVAAGELSASTNGMEVELDRVLELSTRWNAVLLLDEADVFLERRTDNDLQRNTIVSVFLRKLEYYRGIMFLTTNRIHSFDEAFRSRIHIAIRYPDLDQSARRSIWGNFMKKAQGIYNHGVEVSKEDVDQLSQRVLNGREIRNIVKSAQLLASRSKQPLQKKHLDMVWRVEHEDSAWNENDSNTAPNGVMGGKH